MTQTNVRNVFAVITTPSNLIQLIRCLTYHNANYAELKVLFPKDGKIFNGRICNTHNNLLNCNRAKKKSVEADNTQVKWLEPKWSIDVRKRSFRHIFVSKGGGRCLILVAIPCMVFLAAPYVLGVMALAQNRKVIFLATGMLIGFPFALAAMEYLLQFLKLPRRIFVQNGLVVIDDQHFRGELAQIETDQSGHQWLTV